jgi:imidazolonepropionase-like amidohydrolase
MCLRLTRRILIVMLMVSTVLIAACATGIHRETVVLGERPSGTIVGRIVLPPDTVASELAPLSLFLENAGTQEVMVSVLAPGQLDFVAIIPPGRYHVYAWLPDFSQRGGHTVCQPGGECGSHEFEPVTVYAGKTISDIVLDDWYVPEGRPLVLMGTVIDGTGCEPLPDGAVVIRGSRVVDVGPRSEVAIPAGARVVELPGVTLLPGFINAHVHNAYDLSNLEKWAQEGVTTVRDVGQRVGFPYFRRRDKSNADPRYAQVISAGPLVTVPKGYPIAGNNFPSLTVESPEDARDKVDQLIDAGADVIKIVITLGSTPTLSLEEATAIVEAAHSRDIPVTVHVTKARALKAALEAGVDDIAHMVTDRVSDTLIRQMVEDDVSWVPTLQALHGEGKQNLRRFVEAGGRVALGNDGGYLSGLEIGMPIREIEAMHSAGMTRMQVILAATRDAAYVCGRAGALGTLEVGRLANVLAVEGNPLEDLGVLTKVKLVAHEGVVIRAEGIEGLEAGS